MADPYSVNGKTAGMIVGIWLVLFHMVLDVLNQKDQEFIPEFRNSKIGFRMSWTTKVSRLEMIHFTGDIYENNVLQHLLPFAISKIFHFSRQKLVLR